MSLTVSHGCWLSLTVSLVPWSSCMSLTVSYGCWLSLTISTSSIELLHVSRCFLIFFVVSQCLLWLLAVSNCLSYPMELLHVTVSHCFWMSLTLSPVPWSCCMSLTVSYCCWLSLTVSPSAMELLHVSHCLL